MSVQPARYAIDLVHPPPNTSPGLIAVNDLGMMLIHCVKISDGSDEAQSWLIHEGAMQKLGNFVPCGLNNLREVVGYTRSELGYDHALLYKDGTTSTISEGMPGPTFASNINDNSQILFWGFNDDSSVSGDIPRATKHLYLKDGEPIRELHAPSGFWASQAKAMNDVGQVAGYVLSQEQSSIAPISHACLWDEESVSLLGTLPGFQSGEAVAINNMGIVLCVTSDNRLEPAIDPAMLEALLLAEAADTQMGQPTGDMEWQFDLLEKTLLDAEASLAGGKLVRFASFLWENNERHALPALTDTGDVVAAALNDHGEVVGTIETDEGDSHAALWRDRQLFDLNDLIGETGWVLEAAVDINNLSQIVGTGIYEGESRMFLLTPSESPKADLTLPTL